MKNTSILIPIILIGCLGALGFLFYKAMQTVETDQPRTSSPIVLNQSDYTDEEIPDDIGKSAEYDASANDDGFRELTPAEREEARRQSELEEEREAAANEEARKREAQLDAEAAEAARLERERKAAEANSTSGSRGRYLVIAGSFRQKANAEQRVKDLRNAGFNDTRLEKFNRGTYAVALAGQTDRFSAAERLAAQIVGAGFEARVMRRR
ncbi:SPOR domain-containing protein [Neolewinella aurantiaca]|uniref:SPOR domain-containing protein n=1 Tax=Neolewinella aurantiaca TaxID=2602767 RepID=A0A5C7FJS8_9BACT|nr:SPOR domain-containing protein [Neolewinella aurantiaca]TXF90904.1 SPOR domain-containing protein [Neolewinella aurantiaca]